MLSRKAVAGIGELFARTLGKGIAPDALDAWRVELEPLNDKQAYDAAVELVRRKADSFPVVPGALIAIAEERALDANEEGPLLEWACERRGVDYGFLVALSRRIKGPQLTGGSREALGAGAKEAITA